MAGVGVAVAMSTAFTGPAHAGTQHTGIVTEFPIPTPDGAPLDAGGRAPGCRRLGCDGRRSRAAGGFNVAT
jgi:hypothetical protein